MISLDSRPRLASKARLRRDRRTERLMILFPEKGLELSATAADIVRLCDGRRTVAEMIVRLLETYSTVDPCLVEREVLGFLNSLAERCLIEEVP
jgi:coenzyme PQQ biosynthesis protein PqqD